MSKNKITIAIALFLMFAMTISIFVMPLANAHDPAWTISTDAYINVAPNPVGVGQTAYINVWIDKVPPTAEGYWGSVWHDMHITITDPDEDTTDLGTFTSDATGGAWTQFVPDQVGTYTINFEFPTQVAYDDNPYPYFSSYVERNKIFLGDTFTESSASTTLIVQEEEVVSAFPDTPLPTEYWSRPISSMNREWYELGGNWLGLASTSFGTTGMYSSSNGNFNPYTEAPNTAHVMWTEPIAFGGQIGGEFGPDETSLYATGTAYESKFSAVILYGILYYTEYPGAGNNPTGLKAIDLHTGETLWRKNITTPLKCGMVYNFITGDQYGAHAYLFCAPAGVGFINIGGPNWEMYDAMTGELVLQIANASAGRLMEGENGELLSYRVSGGMLSLWNASKCIEVASQKIHPYYFYSAAEIWRPPQGATIDWNDGYEWSVPVEPGLGLSTIDSDVVLLTAQDAPVPGHFQTGWEVAAGYSAVDGHSLWGPINRTLTPWDRVYVAVAAEGVYTEYNSNDLTWYGYDITTGQKLWGPTEPFESPWDFFDYRGDAVIAYGNLYTWGMGGDVHCYDVQTGELKWSWNTGSAGVDNPFGIWPLGTWHTHHVMADGKLYVRAGHDYTPPVFKGAKIYCLNATTGEELWESLSFDIVSSPACADGVMVWFNGYDNQVYAYGKGPSATTVMASPKVSVEGDSILVEGMVTDISPGTEEYAQTARFPNGVPAISDDNMSAWMEYLYQQQAKPTEAMGVDVTVSVLDPNGNYYDVGTATSDASGFYKLMFTPLVPGQYTIIASFAGSGAYYGSHAETAIGVEEAPAPTAAPTPTPASVADLYLLPATAGIIIAIVVIGLVIILMLRKR